MRIGYKICSFPPLWAAVIGATKSVRTRKIIHTLMRVMTAVRNCLVEIMYIGCGKVLLIGAMI